MFVAHYENTMRNAKFAPTAVPPVVRTIEQIRAEKRRLAAIETKRQADELAARQAEARKSLEAIRSYRCVVNTGSNVPARQIIQMVATAKGFPLEEILGNSRNRSVVEARFDAIKAVADARPDMSTPQIGRIFGKDHTTIIHALSKRGGRRPASVRLS